MAYTNATFYMDYVTGLDTARTALTSVIFSDSSGAVLATKIGHGLVTGAVVDITLTTNWNGAWKITRINDDTFTLDGATWSAGADNDGTVTPRGGSSWNDAWKTITAGPTTTRIAAGDIVKIARSPAPTQVCTARWTGTAKASGSLPATKNIASSTSGSNIQITCNGHGYVDGDVVQILGHTTNTAANGDWIVTASALNTFELAGSTGNGTGGATGTIQLINSKVVKLATANITKNLNLCDTAWTQGTSVTATLETSTRKQGYGSLKIVTGNLAGGQELAYIDLGSQIDYSGYEQVSLWFRNEAALASAGDLKIKFYSDAGRTTEVDSFDFPALTISGRWMPLTFDKANTLANNIRCISIVSNIAMNAKTFYIDNIIACKDSASADSLSLSSLISKSSAEQGSTEGWYGIQSINDTIVILDTATSYAPNTGRGYAGATSDSVTYKRETIKCSAGQTLQQAGSAGATIQYQGGYNKDTGEQTGETFFDFQHGGAGTGLYCGKAYSVINWLSFVRYGDTGIDVRASNITFTNIGNISNGSSIGMYAESVANLVINKIWAIHSNHSHGLQISSSCTKLNITTIENCSNNIGSGVYIAGTGANVVGTITKANNNGAHGVYIGASQNNVTTITDASYNVTHGVSIDGVYRIYVDTITAANYNGSNGLNFSSDFYAVVGYVSASYNTNYGINFASACYECKVLSGATANNANLGVYAANGCNYLNNVTEAEGTKISTSMTDYRDARFHVTKSNGVATDHIIYTDYGTISSETGANRHTASGIAWKFSPTNVIRNVLYPLKLTVAKIAVNAGALVTAKIYMKKTHATEIVGKFVCKSYQLTGITTDQITTSPSDTNWNELTVTFTPSEAGVVELEVWCYIAGTSTTDSIYIDDMTITQA